MLPRTAKNRILDKAHRFVVVSCMALTLYGIALGSYKFYNYVTYVKPELRKKREMLKEELMAESSQ